MDSLGVVTWNSPSGIFVCDDFLYHDQIAMSNLFSGTSNLVWWFDCAST